jgi:hypothetical protein
MINKKILEEEHKNQYHRYGARKENGPQKKIFFVLKRNILSGALESSPGAWESFIRVKNKDAQI